VLTAEEKRERRKEYNRQWRLQNPERVKEQNRKYRLENKDKVEEDIHKYRLENQDKIKSTSKTWRLKNLENTSRRNRSYYLENSEDIKEDHKKRREENPEKYQEIVNRSRMDKKPKYSSRRSIKHQQLRVELLKAYGGRCVCCGEDRSELLTVDHINNDGSGHRKDIGSGSEFYIWLKKNGYPKDNFQLLCWNCNMSKAHDKDHVCIHVREKQKPPVSLWSFA
jgi:hypothetical protein